MVTEAIAKKLLRTDILTFTVKVVVDELQESLKNDQQRSQSRKFSDLCLIISIVPVLDAIQARSYFQGQYLTFVEDRLRDIGGEFGKNNIAHWVLCSDGNKMGVHLTLIPAETQGLFLFAHEMLSDSERAQLCL